MRTTLDLNDSVLRDAKTKAAEEGKSLTRIIEEALRRYLSPRKRGGGSYKLRLLTTKAKLASGVDLSDRDSLLERMEGRS